MNNERILISRNNREGGYCGKMLTWRGQMPSARRIHRRGGEHDHRATLRDFRRVSLDYSGADF